MFPATHCVKLIAYSGGKFLSLLKINRCISFLFQGPNPVQYIYRTCGRDEADDNGITRASHCGFVKLNWIDSYRRFRGCLDICDKDACNQTSNYSISRLLIYWNLFIFLVTKNCLNISL